MSYVDCHCLTVQCAVHPSGLKRVQFTAPDLHGCWMQAEDAGWVLIRQEQKALCPSCAKAAGYQQRGQPKGTPK